MRVAWARVAFPPAIASPCGANDGSLKKRPRLPIQRCSTCRRPVSSRSRPAAWLPVRPSGRRTTPPESARSRPRRWGHHFRAHRPSGRVQDALRAPLRAAIDILPFQLEPALALIRGHASRLLLADEVGLGKTIQAGLMLAELRHRGWCDRALIITPAGLRQQWADELRQRFDLRRAVHGRRVVVGA